MTSLTTPYGDILPNLVQSIMRSLAEIVKYAENEEDILAFDDGLINRHFSWLAYDYRQGFNRHLFDGQADGSTFPLLNNKLRAKLKFSEEVKTLFQAGSSIPKNDSKLWSDFVRKEPTRISRLVKFEVLECWANTEELSSETKAVVIPSPLNICMKFLTIPDSTGSAEFAFLAVRNFLSEAFGTDKDGGLLFSKFSEVDLYDSFESVQTYTRDRFNSRGKDHPTRGRAGSFDRYLREFLALRGFLDFRFSNQSDCLKFLNFSDTPSRTTEDNNNQLYEYNRRKNLDRFPDVSDLANLLWGLPLPIRGSDVIFRGGIKFPQRNGLVVAVHGGPGSGKTSFGLGVGASLSALGIRTLFFSAEEKEDDLRVRALNLIPTSYRRLSFFPQNTSEWLDIVPFSLKHDYPEGSTEKTSPLDEFDSVFASISRQLKEDALTSPQSAAIHSPCRLVIVLDGLHDLVNRSDYQEDDHNADLSARFYRFVERCKELEALVILTAGEHWKFGGHLDYLVDIAMDIKHDTNSSDGGKPQRMINLSKARHQSCSAGTHGFQIAGGKGVRFTPEINFCLDVESIWDMRLSDEQYQKNVMCRAAKNKFGLSGKLPRNDDFEDIDGIRLHRSSNIFINGMGSGGKAGLALKMACAPYYHKGDSKPYKRSENILIVSFLYPNDYYNKVHAKVRTLRNREVDESQLGDKFSKIDVIHFYPGFLRPSSLFNRIRWYIEEKELLGDPFTTVILDGLHNVFIQFPELVKHEIVWPQLYSLLRKKDITLITTHTVLTVATSDPRPGYRTVQIDDNRSDPLRHALVQKTDFSFEVDPIEQGGRREYNIEALSAVGQALPNPSAKLHWQREELFFYTSNLLTSSPTRKN